MPGAIYSKQARALGVDQDSPDSSCSSSVSALLRRPSTSSCWHWTRPQRHRCQRNCLRMKRNQTDWRVAQAAVYHRICLPCRSARRELAPGSANQTLVSGSAPCCCARPHQSLLPSPVVADRETMRVGKKRKAPVINKRRGGGMMAKTWRRLSQPASLPPTLQDCQNPSSSTDHGPRGLTAPRDVHTDGRANFGGGGQRLEWHALKSTCRRQISTLMEQYQYVRRQIHTVNACTYCMQ